MNMEELLKLLVCPACHGQLRATGASDSPDGLACERCRLLYPVRNGIPVMLEDEAMPLDEGDS